MSIGIFMSGGDCLGLNVVIWVVVFIGIKLYDFEFVGFCNGWKGVVEGDIMLFGCLQVMGILKQGGMIIGILCINFFEGGGVECVVEVMDENGVEVLIVIGGEGMFVVVKWLMDVGIKIVGVFKMIDNDFFVIDYIFGFDIVVQIVIEVMDWLCIIGDLYGCCMVVEVMG